MTNWLRRVQHRLINGDGRWLAWHLYHDNVVGVGLPTYYQLRWNTRSYDDEHLASCSFNGHRMNVHLDMLQYNVRRWFGRRRTIYSVHVAIEMMVAGQVSIFERTRAFGNYDAAYADYGRHRTEAIERMHTPRPTPQPS